MTPTNIPSDSSPPRRQRTARRAIAAAVLAACLPIAVRGWDVLASTNFHAVVEGRFYRSGQMSGPELTRCIEDHKIKTVVNLRGEGPDAPWYQDEVATCNSLGITHLNVRLSAKQLPPPEEARKLIEILQTAQQPILVHCRNGADRAGLASAAFLIVHQGIDAKSAVEQQLNLYFGHMPVGPSQAMDRFFTLYSNSTDNSGEQFTTWVQNDYVRDHPQTFDSASAR